MKILIIEDDPEIREFVKKGLESEFFTIETSSNGNDGLLMAKACNYSLIILDYLLPEIDGLSILKILRKEKIKTPVLVMSVKSELEDKENFFGIGADDYISKPFLLAEMILRVKALIRRKPREIKRFFKMDNLVLDLNKKTAFRDGKEIYLTKREFCLLNYFFENKNTILSRSNLLENVWTYKTSPFSNSIETHISGLRKKININKNRNLIHTFPGRGYKLSVNKV